MKDNFHSVDYSFPIEVGYAFKNTFAGRGFDLRLRYSHSLGDVLNVENDSRKVRHSVLQFILTLPFVLEEETEP